MHVIKVLIFLIVSSFNIYGQKSIVFYLSEDSLNYFKISDTLYHDSLLLSVFQNLKAKKKNLTIKKKIYEAFCDEPECFENIRCSYYLIKKINIKTELLCFEDSVDFFKLKYFSLDGIIFDYKKYKKGKIIFKFKSEKGINDTIMLGVTTIDDLKKNNEIYFKNKANDVSWFESHVKNRNNRKKYYGATINNIIKVSVKNLGTLKKPSWTICRIYL